jgi:hypothetical protein
VEPAPLLATSAALASLILGLILIATSLLCHHHHHLVIIYLEDNQVGKLSQELLHRYFRSITSYIPLIQA